jgi:hypothetical protein
MRTEAIYGAAPADLGLVDISPVEMMFWLYCPIKLAGNFGTSVPENLAQYLPLLDEVFEDLGADEWTKNYVYLTAKTLWCSPDNPGNRPDWHSDGFLTEDLNYIWYDANPTVFWESDERVDFIAHHQLSLAEMEAVCEHDVARHRRYPLKHLLRLDQTVMHKVDTNITAGVRTFVKISVSKHRYDLKGNSINHELAPDWAYQDRAAERNHPIGNAA